MMIEGYILKQIRPSVVRAELNLTQQELAELAGVQQAVVSRAERGGALRMRTAITLLSALNKKREEKGWRALDVDEVGWNIVSN